MKKKESVYIGLDIGSTHIKAVAYDRLGELKAIARTSTPAHVTKDGGTYHLASELWENTVRSLRLCMEQLEGYRIKGIGIASVAESGVLMDEMGEPLGPVLAWYDQRPNHYLPFVKSRVPSIEFFHKTGLYPKAKYSLLKFLWMKDHLSEQWKKAQSWLHIAEYIAFCMTGIKRTEISLASRTMLLNLKNKKWDEDLIKEFGIKKEILQQITPSGNIVGTVLKEVSEHTKLPEGVPVSIAGHDHIVGSFGIGGMLDGDVTNSCGTAETLVITMEKQDLCSFSEIPSFTVGCHVVADRYYAIIPVGETGSIVEWFLSVTGWDYQELLNSLSKENGMAKNFGFFPAPLGESDADNHLQLAWFGGALSHAYPTQMASALINGLSCLFRYQIEALQGLNNVTMDRLMIIGGATKNPYWMQAKADLLNKPLNIIRDSEGVARGAAILTAKSCDGIEEIPVPPSLTVSPNIENAKKMQDYYTNCYLRNIQVTKQFNFI